MERSSSNGAVGSGSIFTRQLKGTDIWNSSKRWRKKGPKKSLEQIEGLEMASGIGEVLRKKVMVLVDQSTCAKDAMMWALTHVVNKGDHLTLLQIIPPRKDQRKMLHISGSSSCSSSADFAESLVSVCKNFKPEVEVHALAIQGPKLPTVIFQVKKLRVSVLVLGQEKPSPVIWSLDPCFFSNELQPEPKWVLLRSTDLVSMGMAEAVWFVFLISDWQRPLGGILSFFG